MFSKRTYSLLFPGFVKHLYYILYYSLPLLFFQGQQLKVIEQEVLQQLVEQIKLLSESVVSDLERTAAELKTDPQDLHDFSKYAVMVHKHTYITYLHDYMLREKTAQTIRRTSIRSQYPRCTCFTFAGFANGGFRSSEDLLLVTYSF